MKRVAPVEAAFHILDALFGDEAAFAQQPDDDPLLPASRGVTLSAFQQRAVDRGLHMIERHGGVMIADSVGLGKTYIGITIARHFSMHDLPVLAVVPSVLRRQWEIPLRRLVPSCRVISHAALSRGGYPRSLVDGGGLLLIDEAHAFRNPAARRYHAVARLAASRRVCLITATPVNNSLWDLYHLLRLFCSDDAFSALGVPDMRVLFDELSRGTGHTRELRAVVRAVIVRRTRMDVAAEVASAPSRFRFPVPADPVTVRYDVDDGSGRHGSILRAIGALRLDGFASEAGVLMRFLLLKRLASSNAALLSTVRWLVQLQSERIAALHEGFILSSADRPLGRGGRERADQLLLRPLVLRAVAPHADVDELVRSAMIDLGLLSQIERSIHADGPDEKLAALRSLVLGPLATQKVLIFTEFRDTAMFLWRALLPIGHVGMIHGGGAFLGAGRAGRAAVVSRFAPVANGARRVPMRESVRVLIATDVLAEGLNLQDCAHVVSYDLPWNPVRLIQRMGRIDRMGSPHEVVYAYNFVPDRKLDDDLALLRRIRFKLQAIDAVIGLEHAVVAPDDASTFDWRPMPAAVPHPAAALIYDGGDEDLRTWLRTVRERYRASDFAAVVCVVSAQPGSSPGDAFAVVACAATTAVRAFRFRRGTLTEVDPALVARVCIEAARDEPVGHDRRDASRLFQRVLGRLQRDTKTPPGKRSRAASTIAALRLQQCLGAIPGGPTREQAAVAEQLIQVLGRSHGPAVESQLADLARQPKATFEAIADRICLAVGPAGCRSPSPARAGSHLPEWRPVCAVFAVSAVDPSSRSR